MPIPHSLHPLEVQLLVPLIEITMIELRKPFFSFKRLFSRDRIKTGNLCDACSIEPAAFDGAPLDDPHSIPLYSMGTQDPI